jgi:anti-sigma-K factor RskA
MDLSELYRKLIAAARSEAPDARVPYAFEKRIMARLAGQIAADSSALWSRALWRAAMCCVAFMMMLGFGFHFLPPSSPDNLSQDVEQTLFAAVDSSADQGGDLR